MAAHLEHQNLKGFANWMRVQAKEENDHAMGLYNHMLERGGVVVLEEIKKPTTDFSDVLAIFEATLTHEQHITKKIHDIFEVHPEVQYFPHW